MDLVDRKEILRMLNENYIVFRGEFEKMPSVEAVPLEPLCEWLAGRYEPPYSLVEVDKLKCPIDFRQQKEIWMVALTKWMEGLDGTD